MWIKKEGNFLHIHAGRFITNIHVYKINKVHVQLTHVASLIVTDLIIICLFQVEAGCICLVTKPSSLKHLQ